MIISKEVWYEGIQFYTFVAENSNTYIICFDASNDLLSITRTEDCFDIGVGVEEKCSILQISSTLELKQRCLDLVTEFNIRQSIAMETETSTKTKRKI